MKIYMVEQSIDTGDYYQPYDEYQLLCFNDKNKAEALVKQLEALNSEYVKQYEELMQAIEDTHHTECYKKIKDFDALFTGKYHELGIPKGVFCINYGRPSDFNIVEMKLV